MAISTTKKCPKCHSCNFTLGTEFKGVAEFCEVKEGVLLAPLSASAAETFQVLYEPHGMDCIGVHGECKDCGHKWRLKGVLHAQSVFEEVKP